MTGFWAYGLGTGCMLVAASLVTVFALTTQVSPEPWYHPRYALSRVRLVARVCRPRLIPVMVLPRIMPSSGRA